MSARQSAGPNGSAGPKTVRVFRVPENKVVQVLFVNPTYGGVLTHWVRGESEYCKGSDCRTDWHKLEATWKGYTGALIYNPDTGRWDRQPFELTENVEREMRDVYARGQVWEFYRPKKAKDKNGAVTCRLLETRDLDDVEFPPFSVLDILRVMYHVEEIKLNVKNPMPKREVVVEVSAPPPAEVKPAKPDTVPVGEARFFREKLKAAGFLPNGKE